MAPATAASRGKNSGKKSENVSTGSRNAPPKTGPATQAPAQASALPPKANQSPNLEPWMRQTVVLRLKEVEGKVPDMSTGVFGKKMVMEQGFSKAETVSIQTFIGGLFYITFASMAICRRYWERVKAAGPESPFTRFVGNSPIQREERRVTVAMRNPHTPVKDIITFLSRFCTVIKDPSQIMDSNGFWTGKYSVLVKLQREEGSADGLKHLPQSFSLGSSPGLLYYPDQPQTCRKCGQLGHQAKTCTANACRICKVLGHEAKNCPRSKACNLCGLADHIYRDCPQRSRTYASVAQAKPTPPAPANTQKKGKPPAPAKAKVTPPAPAKNNGNKEKNALCKKRTREAEESPAAEQQQERKKAVTDLDGTTSSEEGEEVEAVHITEVEAEDMELLLEELEQIPVEPADVNRVLQLEEALLQQLESPEESPPPPDNAGGDPPDRSGNV
ncbi:zinc finger CCHC domain-containing protein 3-like [Xenopus tropicalis]|uniref:Zinc finger CCHC domain-containing protein 3-like n=1 Tax=Xenopus tropicalis TaxID=8364 RepID=A0A8J1IPK2_XENTR|nr:zinc finger CCHC domain-containing protein 3-like [Xenopus tropicalis]XP_031747740.1 zinc finger CCHC domain-containing protein 3-like [Xenopus tropicalis]